LVGKTQKHATGWQEIASYKGADSSDTKRGIAQDEIGRETRLMAKT
jgi:hypothetical protein